MEFFAIFGVVASLTDIKDIRIFLCGLSFECPLDGGNPHDCRCHDLREMPVIERIHAIAHLSDDECRRMHDGHKECLKKKSSGEK